MTTFAAAVLVAAISLGPTPAHPPAGVGLGEIRIPAIGLEQPIDQGTNALYSEPWPAELRNGPAHYPQTALPWQRGVTALAGHRTTYTRPFHNVDKLKRGDTVILATKWGTFWYRVKRVLHVRPGNLSVLGFLYRKGRWYRNPYPRGHWLTLTACDPPGQATRRIVVKAVLTRLTRARS